MADKTALSGVVLPADATLDNEAARLRQVPRAIVARGVKSAGNIAVTTAELRIMMIPIPVVAGRSYLITARAEVDTTVADGFFTGMIRYTFGATGSPPADPLVTSTLLDRALGLNRVASVPFTLEVVGQYDATATGTLKAVLTVTRNSSSGQATVRTDGIAHRMWAEDMGLTVAAAQTNY